MTVVSFVVGGVGVAMVGLFFHHYGCSVGTPICVAHRGAVGGDRLADLPGIWQDHRRVIISGGNMSAIDMLRIVGSVLFLIGCALVVARILNIRARSRRETAQQRDDQSGEV